MTQKCTLHVSELLKSQMELMLLINIIYLWQYIEAKQFHNDLVPITSYINKIKYFSRPKSNFLALFNVTRIFNFIALALYPKDTFLCFSKQSRPRSGRSCRSCLIRVYSVCLWKYSKNCRIRSLEILTSCPNQTWGKVP